MTLPPRRITVLMGGNSSEREISLSSGRGIVNALRSRGHIVSELDTGQTLDKVVAGLMEQKPDVVFNGLHGRFGEDGAVQGVLEWMQLPYTHSGIRASAVAMDKHASRQLFQSAGLPVAQGALLTPGALAESDPLPLPYVVKPVSEGSSVGVFILRKGSNQRVEIARTWKWGTHILAEEFIPGREITVGVLEDENRVPHPLTVTDITPDAPSGFYDYEAKYSAGGSRHVLPADIHPDIFAKACRIAVEAHRVLGCSGASRTDFRYDDTTEAGKPGRIVILEVNTQPGMTPTSLLPEQAAFCGVSYEDLCERMVLLAGTHL